MLFSALVSALSADCMMLCPMTLSCIWVWVWGDLSVSEVI